MRLFDRFLKRGSAAAIDDQRDPDVLFGVIHDGTKSARERKRAIRRLGDLYADRTGGPIEQLIQMWMSPDTSAEAAAALDTVVGPGSFRLLTLFESARGVETNALARGPLDQIIASMTGHYVTSRYEAAIELYLTALKYPQLTHGARRALEFLTDALVARRVVLHEGTSLLFRLCHAIGSDNIYVKTNALVVLRKILNPHLDTFGANAARDAVEAALKDANPHIRVSAINAFVSIAPPSRSSPRLKLLLEVDSDLRVREFAKEALDSL